MNRPVAGICVTKQEVFVFLTTGVDGLSHKCNSVAR